MNSVEESELRGWLHATLDTISPGDQLSDRMLRALRDHAAAAPRRRALPRVAAIALATGVVAAFTIALVFGVGLRGHRSTTTAESFSDGMPAEVPADARSSYVWLMGPPVRQPSTGSITAFQVDVIDWTGALRHQFQLPGVSATPQSIRAISADGTRALLSDGTVLDETGAVVGHIQALPFENGPASTGVRWADDDNTVCEAVSHQQQVQASPPAAPGATPPPASLPPWALPGADHSVALEVIKLGDPSGRLTNIVASVGGGAIGEPSGTFPDSTSVLSCSPKNDIAVIARYHDATDPTAEQTAGTMTASIWAVRISTGQVLFHQPETAMASGRPFFFGSQSGNLAVEFLWNSVTAGSEVDKVIHIPSGAAVPVTDAEAVPDTPAVSADGTRILRRVVDTVHHVTRLELLDASDGSVIRAFVLHGVQGAMAVAHGTSFLVQVDGKLVVIDQVGGSTVLDTPVTLGGSNTVNGVSMFGTPGLQG